MQTGKVLGIGAALSAGLLAAHVASASIQTGVEISDPLGAYLTVSSGDYSAAGLYKNNGSAGGYLVGLQSTNTSNTPIFTWSSLQVSVLGPGALGFSVQDLNYTGSAITSASFLATGTGFTYLSTNPNTLTSTGGGGYTGPGSYVTMSQAGYAAASDAAFDRSGDNTGGPYPSAGVGGGTLAPSSGSNTGVTDLPGTGYSLTYTANFTFNYSANANEGNTFGTATDPAGGTVSILGGTASAVTLPGSGPLSLVGGLVVVGGLAIRRRMKL